MKQITAFAPTILAALLLAACGNSSQPVSSPALVSPPLPAAAKVRFIAFGDAGRANTNQMAVGAAMAQLCKLKGCDFAIETGDNIYDGGVGSTTDPQWMTKFELPYADIKVPIYPTLGNHDNSQAIVAPGEPALGEGSSNTRGNFQVDYTKQTGTSAKWTLPARYHSFKTPLNLKAGDTPVIEFFCLDSSPLAATMPNPAEVNYNYLTYGPTEMQWFQQALMGSKANWKIAYGHHPYISNGQHGNAGSFDSVPANVPGTSNGKPWKDLFEASACAMNLDFYMFGHDHDLEWLKPVSSCNAKTEFILTGAGSDVRNFGNATRNPTFWQQDLAQGFFWFEVSANSFTGESYFFTDGKLPLDALGQPKPAFTRTVTK